MTKRGIDESVGHSTFVGTDSSQPLNGASNVVTSNGSTLEQSMKIENSPNSDISQHNENMDVMPNLKKIKVDSDPNHNGNSTGTSPNSTTSSSGTISTVVASTTSVPVKSRVIHIRNIPPDTVVNDLYQLASPFGTITKHLLVKSKNQAFIEFDSHFPASQMANYWIQTTICGIPTHVQPSIRGRHVHCQLSNHKELKMTFENPNNNNNGEYTYERKSNGTTNGNAIPTTIGENTSPTPSPVIRVVIENLCYSVTLDALHTIFSRTGKVQKIVTFTKGNVFQVLVQFADISSSIQAKVTLDGQNMFSGANTLRIEYSKLQNLIVKYNNEKSRDYTQPGLTAGNLPSGAAISVNGATSSMNGQPTDSDLNTLLAATAPGTGLQTLGPFGAFTSNGQYATSPGNPRYATGHTIQALNNAALNGLVNPANAAMFAGAGLTGLLSPVIHVSGLNDEHTTPDALFTLFGVYGDVVRVKILFNKKDIALIQMAEPAQAQLAISHLDRIRLFGKILRVNSSKHQLVQMPKDGHQDSGLTKDYTSSPLHRFKRPGSRNYNNIYPPSVTLHVSNIPPTCTEDDLKADFERESGKEVTKFKFFPNDHRMALVQFDNIESAIHALIKMHNFKVAEHSHLRVSFSKSPV